MNPLQGAFSGALGRAAFRSKPSAFRNQIYGFRHADVRGVFRAALAAGDSRAFRRETRRHAVVSTASRPLTRTLAERGGAFTAGGSAGSSAADRPDQAGRNHWSTGDAKMDDLRAYEGAGDGSRGTDLSYAGGEMLI